jgi:hypothetical protein
MVKKLTANTIQSHHREKNKEQVRIFQFFWDKTPCRQAHGEHGIASIFEVVQEQALLEILQRCS